MVMVVVVFFVDVCCGCVGIGVVGVWVGGGAEGGGEGDASMLAGDSAWGGGGGGEGWFGWLAGGTGRGRPDIGFSDFLETGFVVGFFVGLEVACVVALGALSLLEIVLFLKKALA